MGISSIAFDGIHRCGKSTQISMLQKTFQEHSIYNLTIRGEHYRDGKGLNHITDPLSDWWRKNKMTTDYNAKSQRLNRELRYFYTKFLPSLLEKIGVEDSIIIQDRSIVGRYMFKVAGGESTKDIESLKYGAHERMVDTITIPDVIFVLQPSQQELLRRLDIGYDPSQENAVIRHAYKKKYITKKYNSYYNVLSILPEHISNRIHYIQSNKCSADIHKEILDVLKNKHIFEGEDNRRQEAC